MKVKAGVNFINILRTAFMLPNPKSAKIQSRTKLLGSEHVKAACKMLVKLTLALTTEKLQAILLFKKAGHKM